jgi:hypothetical protein
LGLLPGDREKACAIVKPSGRDASATPEPTITRR